MEKTFYLMKNKDNKYTLSIVDDNNKRTLFKKTNPLADILAYLSQNSPDALQKNQRFNFNQDSLVLVESGLITDKTIKEFREFEALLIEASGQTFDLPSEHPYYEKNPLVYVGENQRI